MKTQNEIVLRHLKTWGSLTALEAARRYNVWRLAARIYDLRLDGVKIKMIREANTLSPGSHAKYVLS
jgi:hypothetical protein